MISRRSSPKRKRRDLTPFVVLILLFPYIAGFTSDSTSSYSDVTIGLGTGQYVFEDCSGVHSRKFTDAGVTLTKKHDGPFRTGLLLGGVVMDGGDGFVFLYPDLALDWQYFSLGTTGVRIGDRNDLYAEGGWLNDAPLNSGKGVLHGGIGGRSSAAGARWWVGTNIIPYREPGLAVRYEFPYSEHSFLILNGRIGTSQGRDEYGFSVGMRFIAH